MPYCSKCGAELAEGAVFCTKCGTPVMPPPPPPSAVETVPTIIPELRRADWGARFVAWLIDIIIVGLVISPLKFVFSTQWPALVWAPGFLRWIPFMDFGLDNFIHFLYWTVMEGLYGQSIGKMLMKIRAAQLNGERIDVVRAAIGSLGKAFLLPIDCIVGWLLYPGRHQRLFNHITETTVIRD